MSDISRIEPVHVETEAEISKTHLQKMNTTKPRLHPTKLRLSFTETRMSSLEFKEQK
jgi:hypothetical protein